MNLKASLALVLLISGCAITLTADEQEYERTDWIESEAKPAIEYCMRTGILVYDGPYNIKIKRMLDNKGWSKLRKTDFVHFKCAERK